MKSLRKDKDSNERFRLQPDILNATDHLIVEFSVPISLMTISMLRCVLEKLLGLRVDIIHGPIQSTDMIEIGKDVELYAA